LSSITNKGMGRSSTTAAGHLIYHLDFEVVEEVDIYGGGYNPPQGLLTVNFHQPSHEFTFGVGIYFIS
jgi:hypothetical protein